MARPRLAPTAALEEPDHRYFRRAGIILATTVVAMVLAGQLLFVVKAISSGAWLSTDSNVQVPTTGTLSHRLTVLLQGALGGSDRGARRFAITGLHTEPGASGHTVAITWAINNDISAGTLGNGAQADAYVLLRDLYTSGLPITTVQLAATYPIRSSQGRERETVVMRLAMSAKTAATITKIGWDNFDAQTLWPLIRRQYINPQFQPLAPE